MSASPNTPAKERGAVLLTTLLIIAVIASLCVTVMDRTLFAVKRTANMNNYTQADWYAEGAEDFASAYLDARLSALEPAALNALLLTPQTITFPIEDGVITLSIRDGS